MPWIGELGGGGGGGSCIFSWSVLCSIYKSSYICSIRGCSGSQKVGARKIARCHFQVPVLKVRSQLRSQLKFLQGANFFEPKLWMIACTTTSFMFSFMYKWSGFVCTNVNVCIVFLFFISISSSKTKKIYIIYYNILYFTDYQGFSQDFETISHFCGIDF